MILLFFNKKGFNFEVVSPSVTKQVWYMMKYPIEILYGGLKTNQLNEIQNAGIKLNKICMTFSHPSMIKFNCQ